MQRSWLIQRLESPVRVGKMDELVDSMAFGGGLKHGGLNEEAFQQIREVMRFDHMGSAEFEFGALPKCLERIIAERESYTVLEMTIPFQAKLWKKGLYDRKSGVGNVLVICREADKQEIAQRIKTFAMQDHTDTKERVALSESMAGCESWGKIKGWLDLDNDFFFFTDRKMFEGTCRLFGIGWDTLEAKKLRGKKKVARTKKS